jgi:hypothetical protein
VPVRAPVPGGDAGSKRRASWSHGGRAGRSLHFLNPVPIRLIHDRLIDEYTERRVSALAELKSELEKETA